MQRSYFKMSNQNVYFFGNPIWPRRNAHFKCLYQYGYVKEIFKMSNQDAYFFDDPIS